MRRLLIGLTAAAVLLVAGCSDGDGGGVAGKGSGGSAAEFCKEFKDLNKDLDKVDSSDSKAVDEGFKKLDALDPPAEIADEYHKIVDLSRDAMNALKDIDANDPQAVAKAQAKFADRRQELQGAARKVRTFLDQKCHIDTGTTSGQ